MGAGVRLAEAVPQDMIAMPLGPDTRHVVVGAPSYFANKSRPTAPADLMDHECIRARYSSGALYRWEFERHGEAMRIDVPGSLTLDEPDMIAQASRAGIGLAYVGKADTSPTRLRDHIGLIECEEPRYIDPHRFAATFKLPAVKSATWIASTDA